MIGWMPSFIGRALRGKRAGLDKTLCHDAALAAVPGSIVVESAAFAAGGVKPRAHSVDGEGSSPPLAWRGVPSEARAVVLLAEDADSPTPGPFVHLVAWGLPHAGAFAAGAFNKGSAAVRSGSVKICRNGMMAAGYTPPDPPPGHGPHRYIYQVYALDHDPQFASPPGRDALAAAIRGHAIAKGVLEGVYERT
jgi:Raf kinase inhibitor-like YbhB/YbcL family protein